MRSRVMPGSLVTMERRVPVKRLKSVDLPTLGRPTMTRVGRRAVMNLMRGAILHCIASVPEPEDAKESSFQFSVLNWESMKKIPMDTRGKKRRRDKMAGLEDEQRREGDDRRHSGAEVSAVPYGRDIPVLHLARLAENV